MSTSALTPAAGSLEARLVPVAHRIRTVGFRLIKVMTKLTGVMLTPDEVQHLSLTAAFEAYLELGGDPERPTEFDFAGRAQELEKAGLRWLKRETVGRNTEFGDITTRLSSRKMTAFVESYRWSAWAYATTEARSSEPKAERPLEYAAPVEQERAMMASQIHAFSDDLKAVLDPQSYQWLIERFRDDVTQTEQIDRFIAANPSYQDATGRLRAENYINQKVSRARRRAAAMLADKWATTAREVGAQ